MRGAHAGLERRLERGIGKEIHVVEARDAAAQHLGAGGKRAIAHKLGGDMALLGRPDVLLEPAHQRQVVGQPAHQRHRCVRVRVDQPGDEDVLGELDALIAGEALARIGYGQHRLDFAVPHRDGMCCEYRAGRLDRHQPARLDDELAYLGVPCISTTTRRLGARHSISDLRSF